MMVTYPSTTNLRKAKGQEVTIAYGRRHLLLFRLATTNKKSIFVIDSIAGVRANIKTKAKRSGTYSTLVLD